MIGFLASATSPFFLVLLVLLAGAILLWIPRLARAGRVAVAVGVVLLMLIGWAPVADRTLRVYEASYPPVLDAATLPDSSWVVVLGGGTVSDPHRPPISWLTEASLARLAEGIRLQRAIPGSRLVVSGAAISDTVATADAMAATAISLGVDPAVIVVEARPRNTAKGGGVHG